jgi:hypothetical protein
VDKFLTLVFCVKFSNIFIEPKLSYNYKSIWNINTIYLQKLTDDKNMTLTSEQQEKIRNCWAIKRQPKMSNVHTKNQWAFGEIITTTQSKRKRQNRTRPIQPTMIQII